MIHTFLFVKTVSDNTVEIIKWELYLMVRTNLLVKTASNNTVEIIKWKLYLKVCVVLIAKTVEYTPAGGVKWSWASRALLLPSHYLMWKLAATQMWILR